MTAQRRVGAPPISGVHMKQEIVGILIAVSVAFFVSGCAKAVKPEIAFRYHPGVRATDYLPLQTGNAWTYDIAQFDPGNDTPQKSNLITRIEKVDGEAITMLSGDQFVKYVSTPDGVKKASGMPLIPQPIHKGATWPISLLGISGTGEIVSVHERVVTDAGDFSDCLLVEEVYDKEGLKIRYAYAPLVGLVRMEDYVILDDQEFLHTLVTLRIYKVGNPDGS